MLDYNNPVTWATVDLYKEPDGFNAQEFQEKINKIFGLTDSGLPLVRLVWAPDRQKCYSKFYTKWAASGFGIETELRAKYRWATIQIPNSADEIDIPPPRWIIEDYEHPARYMASWEQTRFDPQGRERRPAPPPWGYYCHLYTIAKHNETCCATAKKSHVVCWGEYREPDERDIAELRRAKHLRDKDVEIPLDQPLSEETLALLKQNTVNEQKRLKAAKEERIREIVDENALEMIAAVTGADLSDKTAKFSLPKRKET